MHPLKKITKDIIRKGKSSDIQYTIFNIQYTKYSMALRIFLLRYEANFKLQKVLILVKLIIKCRFILWKNKRVLVFKSTHFYALLFINIENCPTKNDVKDQNTKNKNIIHYLVSITATTIFLPHTVDVTISLAKLNSPILAKT